jgi:hypothetical protein
MNQFHRQTGLVRVVLYKITDQNVRIETNQAASPFGELSPGSPTLAR